MNIIDIHTHGFGGYDTRTSDFTHIHRIAELHGSYGVSEIVPTIYPATLRVMRDNMEIIRRAMQMHHGEDVSKNGLGSSEASDQPPPKPAGISGIHLEGPFLNPAKCGALNAITFLEPSVKALSELIEGYEDIIKIITVSPELEGARELIKAITDRGIIVSMGHSDATYTEAEAGFRAGARGITHLFNAMRGYHHREPGIAGFGLLNRDVYVEVIADPYHLHPATLEVILKVKNHDRIIIVSDSVKGATSYSKGQAVTDAYGNLLGGCMAVTESVKMLTENGHDESEMQRFITENPARYLSQGL